MNPEYWTLSESERRIWDKGVYQTAIRDLSLADELHLKKMLGEEFSSAYAFEIVYEPKGFPEDADNPFENGVAYVDQEPGGGLGGDVFKGTMYIPLRTGLWLKFEYVS